MANIQLNYFNGTAYEILYPQTLGSLVSGSVASSDKCTGNSATATKLASTFGIRTNLGSTSYVYVDGSTSVQPGVTGTLPVARGGTGVTSLSSLASSLNSYLSTGIKQTSGSYTGTGASYNNTTVVKLDYLSGLSKTNIIFGFASGFSTYEYVFYFYGYRGYTLSTNAMPPTTINGTNGIQCGQIELGSSQWEIKRNSNNRDTYFCQNGYNYGYLFFYE